MPPFINNSQPRLRKESEFPVPTDADRGRIADAYKHGGLGVPTIAKRFGFSENQVYGVLYTAGFALRTRAKTDPAIQFEIRRLHANGVAMRKLSAQFGVSPTTVFRIVHKSGGDRA
jgi:Mor family transcriptional regulator